MASFPTAKEKFDSNHKDLHAWDKRVLKGPRDRPRSTTWPPSRRRRRMSFSTDVNMKQKELAIYIKNLLEQDEIYWAQRGRVSWLRRGDRNTSYIQHFASGRRRMNLIKRLKNQSTGWVEGNYILKPLIGDYFAICTKLMEVI